MVPVLQKRKASEKLLLHARFWFSTQVLLQLNRPVGVFQEGAPRLVLAMRQLEVEHRTAFWLFRLTDKGNVRLLGRAAAFLDVADHEDTDDILPSAHATMAARHTKLQTNIIDRNLVSAEHDL